MSLGLKLAFTADLHMNHAKGQNAVTALLAHLEADPPDVLVLAGDVATSTSFGASLKKFSHLPGFKAVVPGNHDLWVPTTHATDSLHAYQKLLPAEAAQHGFHWLDGAPMVLPDHGLAIAGSVNWYDGSWSAESMRATFPDEMHRLVNKRFLVGRHNDAAFVRMPLDDKGFTDLVVRNFERHLEKALERVRSCIVVAHHPPAYRLSFPREGPPTTLDGFLWDAFAGNTRMEAVLARHADRIPFVFCGHTHREREERLGPTRGYNIGGGYHRKRLLRLEWPLGTVTAHEFSEEGEEFTQE